MTKPINMALSLWQSLLGRIRRRPDSEFQQALIRVVIGAGFYAYFGSGLFHHPEAVSGIINLIAVIFLGLSTGLLLATLWQPGASAARRVFGALLDFSTASLLLLIGGETSGPLVLIYFWVTIGNGFRYGVNYLYLSTVLAAIGFMSVLAYNNFWYTHLPLGIGLLLAIIAVPLYAATLMRQLHHAIKRAEQASQAKSYFLANMSHELRTPLNGVIGVADLLAETRLDHEQRELTQIIRASADTLLGLIENVLDISRIEAGHLILTQEDFDLHALANGIVKMMAPAAQKKGLTLAAHIAPETPFSLHGDASHLRQILVNLLGNAIKFTEQGRVDLSIRPATAGDNTRLYFQVADTGIGIPEAAKGHIFDSFSQADPSITRRYGGSGLGTAIAKQIAELMGGRVGLHSQVGVGSTFWFEIPFQPAALSTEQKMGTTSVKGRVAFMARGETGQRLEQLVNGWGLVPQALDSAQAVREALRATAAAEGTLAAIILAVDSLPSAPADFLDSLDSSGRHGWPPLILIDADPVGRDEAGLLRAGYAAVLSAPINPSLLFNAIHTAASTIWPENVVSIADRFQDKAGSIRLRILVADDNPVNQRVIRGLMAHAGHEVIVADNGEIALDILENEVPGIQLAIIDMQMPTLSGTDVVRRWRYLETGHLPIVMLTADAREESRLACREAGADVFLTKPVNSRALIDAVARLATAADQAAAPNIVEGRQTAAPVLDEGILDDLTCLGGGPQFVADLIKEFTQDSLGALAVVERAAQERDYPLLRDHLHMLKGGASDVGASQLAQLCVEAEHLQPYELGTPLASEKLAQVRAGWAAAGARLTEYLSRQTNALGR